MIKDYLEKSNAWHKKIIKQASSKDNEIEWKDYKTVKDFLNGFKFVELVSKQCYEREWKIMSHCVWSYYWGNTKIYSLRDKKNMPHCTIEKDNQIKGKWNWYINPKYVKYVVEFLEQLWMTVWENEMKNLWYFKLDKIEEGLTCKKMYNGYVYQDNLEDIKDNKWNTYRGFLLLNIKRLLEVKLDFSIKWNFDINLMLNYFNNNINDKNAVANESSSTAVANESFSTAVANKRSSTAVANEHYSTAVANESFSTAVANKHYSTAVANESYSTAVANESSSTAVANESYSTAVANKRSSTAVANGHSSTAVANESYSTAVANGHSSTAVANESFSTAVANRSYSTAVANESSSTAVANESFSTVVANESSSTAVANESFSTVVANKAFFYSSS